MKFHRRHAFEPELVASVVVEIEVALNSGNQFLAGSKLLEVVHFGFQNSPEAFHGTVVDTSADTGHTLTHIGRHEPVVK